MNMHNQDCPARSGSVCRCCSRERMEWHELAARIEELHAEAWSSSSRERGYEIMAETNRCRARIAEIVALGVEFEPV